MIGMWYRQVTLLSLPFYSTSEKAIAGKARAGDRLRKSSFAFLHSSLASGGEDLHPRETNKGAGIHQCLAVYLQTAWEVRAADAAIEKDSKVRHA